MQDFDCKQAHINMQYEFLGGLSSKMLSINSTNSAVILKYNFHLFSEVLNCRIESYAPQSSNAIGEANIERINSGFPFISFCKKYPSQNHR
jgi:hypothetical protein